MSIDEHDVDDERDGLLSRWSRRKAAARTGVDLAEPATEAPSSRQAQPFPEALAFREAPPLPDAPPMPADSAAEADAAPVSDARAEDAPLPAMESLGEHSDYSAFLREKVPAAVRKQALRKLFSSAKFNIVDGLDDYDDDFRAILPLGDIITSDMRHKVEMDAERAKEKALAEARALEENQEQNEQAQDAAALEEGGEPAAADAVESDGEAAEQQTLAAGDVAEPGERTECTENDDQEQQPT